MTLLDRILARGVVLPSDPVIASRVERHMRRIQPDPLFRRRLRSVVVNRYVATREGLVPPIARRPARQQMGALGRGVLYASLLTAVSVSAAGAASQDSLPGDPLYGMKVQLEQLRIRVAPPGLRDDLAAMALDERLDELEQLAAAGQWDMLDGAADRAEAAEAQLTALLGGDPHDGAGGPAADLRAHADRLQQLMGTAPAAAREGLERALNTSNGDSGGPDQPPGNPDHGTSQPNPPNQPPEHQPATGSESSPGAEGSQGSEGSAPEPGAQGDDHAHDEGRD